MSRVLLVEGDKDLKVTIPDDARVTFGPFSPPGKNEVDNYRSQQRARGTLRIYQGGVTKAHENILAVFTNVTGFRDLNSVDVSVKVAVEEGATVWNSDKNGYRREEKVSRKEEWADETDGLLTTSEESEEDDGF